MDNAERSNDRWPHASGDMSARIRAHNWSSTPLGTRDRWLAELRCAVDLVLASPIIASVVVGAKRVLIYNDAAAALYGDKHPAALGRPVAESWPDAWAETAHLYERVFSGESIHVPAQPLDLERTDAGQVFDAYLIPVRGPDGAVIAAHMNGFEVGARLQTETALKANEEKYRTLFETMGQGYCELELLRDASGRAVDQRYLELNPAYERLIGIPVAQAKGRTAREVMPELEPWWTETFDRIAKLGAPERIEYQVASLGRWFEVFAYPRGGDRLTVLYEDVTERKRAEQALSASEAQLRAFVSATSDAIYRMSADWKEMRQLDGRGFLADTKAPTIRWWDEYIFPEDRPHIQSAITKAIKAKSPFEMEHRVRRVDGTEGWTFSRAIPILGVDCQIIEWFGTAQDISPRRRVDTESRESEKHQAFLLNLSDMLRTEPDADAIAHRAMAMLMDCLHVDRCFIAQPRSGEDRNDIPYQLGNDRVALLPDHIRPSDFPSALEMWNDRTLVVEDVATVPGLTEDDRRNMQSLGFASIISAAVRVGPGNPQWTLALLTAAPRRWRRGEIALAEAVSERTWAAIERSKNEAALRDSEARLRQFGEASQDVLWIRDAETLQWTYLTPAFETIYGLSREEALSGENYRNWVDLILPEDREHATRMIDRVRAGEHATFDYCIKRPSDGAIPWIRNTDFPIVDASGTVTLIGGIGHDATELLETEAQLHALIGGMPQLVWRAVDGGHWTWASPQWTEFTGQAEADSHEFGWLSTLHPDDRGKACEAWRYAIERGGIDVEYRICDPAAHSYRWFQSRAEPVRDRAGAIIEWLGTSTDIHDLRVLQDRQQVMVKELQHRTRNLITVVGALFSQTMKGATSLPDFDQRFGHRLAALSRVQGLLSHLSAGKRVTFDELLTSELSALGAPADRLTIEGPAGVPLRSATVQTFSLALHELATNALKYGAPSAPGGNLRVRWSVADPHGDNPRLLVDWRETGVDTTQVKVTNRGGGYGRELIERALPYQLGADTIYEMTPDGVHCTIDVEISKVQAHADRELEDSAT